MQMDCMRGLVSSSSSPTNSSREGFLVLELDACFTIYSLDRRIALFSDKIPVFEISS